MAAVRLKCYSFNKCNKIHKIQYGNSRDAGFTCVCASERLGSCESGLQSQRSLPTCRNPTADQLRTTTHVGCDALSEYLRLILPPAGPYCSNCTNCGFYVARIVYGLFAHSSVGAAWLLCGTLYSYVWLHTALQVSFIIFKRLSGAVLFALGSLPPSANISVKLILCLPGYSSLHLQIMHRCILCRTPSFFIHTVM